MRLFGSKFFNLHSDQSSCGFLGQFLVRLDTLRTVWYYLVLFGSVWCFSSIVLLGTFVSFLVVLVFVGTAPCDYVRKLFVLITAKFTPT